jgi:hypothetical protein
MICEDKSKMEEITDNFLLDNPKKKVWGNFRIEYENGAMQLVYRSISSNRTWNREYSRYDSDRKTDKDVIAFKTGEGMVLGNASILPLVGRTVAWGYEHKNARQSVIQGIMETSQKYEMVPFNVFSEAKLDLSTFKTINTGGAETVKRNRENPDYKSYDSEEMEKAGIPEFLPEDAHFMGSKLFSVSSKETDTEKTFLFDIDRNEIKHGIFNPFLVEVPQNGTPIKTVDEAYDSLVPEAVKQAMEAGKNVIRQGEWYFIPTTESPIVEENLTTEQKRERAMSLAVKASYGNNKRELIDLLGNEEYERLKNISIPQTEVKRFELRAGKNRPNHADKGIKVGEKYFVSGEVSHSGREHKTITLDGWHEAMPNEAIGSFTITGDVD